MRKNSSRSFSAPSSLWGDSYLRMLLLVFVFMLGISLPLTAGEITSYIGASERRVYVNSEDQELRWAVRRDGSKGARSLLERRRQALAGIDDYIEEVARQHGIDPKLVHTVIEVESRWNPFARSRKGALGLMQLMPETMGRFGVRDPFNPRENIRGGVRYLRFLLDHFKQNVIHALAAYNAGETVVTARGDIPAYQETRDYVQRVRALYGRMQMQSIQSAQSVHQVEENGRKVYTNLY